MGAFIGVIFGIWFLVALVTWPYFWAKKTDRSQAPIVRRGLGLVYALGWPYHIVAFFRGRDQVQQARANQQAAHDRILGNNPSSGVVMPPTTPPSSPGTSSSRIQNPFDN